MRGQAADGGGPRSLAAAGALVDTKQADVPGDNMKRRANPYGQERKIARSQRKRLCTIIDNLADMAVEWDGPSSGLECDFNMLTEEVKK